MEWRSERRGSAVEYRDSEYEHAALRIEWSALEEGQCVELNSMKINSNESQTIIGELKAVGGESDN